MPHSLNEPSLSFSSTLAATIGLEEAILLRILCDAQQWLNMQQDCCVYQSQLEKALPFWQPQDIERIAKSLADKGIIQLSGAPYMQSSRLQFKLQRSIANNHAHDDNELSDSQSTYDQPAESNLQAATNNRAQQSHSTNAPGLHDSPRQELASNSNGHSYGANLIPDNWQPSKDVLAQLAQHQIPLEFIQQQIADFVLYWRERAEVSHAWGSRFVKQTIRNWQHRKAQVGFEPQAQQPHTMHKAWRPSQDALNILLSVGIEHEFIEEAIPEFILYWQERGITGNSWNSLFVKHVKRQWASYTTTLQYDNEPKLITKDWQPSEDAFEVLQLANIDLQFARSEVPSFVLFWFENKQMQSSWNSKYIQHVKYQWAKRHQINIEYAHERQQQTGASSTTKDPDFIRRHKDTSWAEGL